MALHAVDIIRRKRDGHALAQAEIAFMVDGASSGSIADDQLAAWLMACFLRGLDRQELAVLTLAMRDSGEKRNRIAGNKQAVDKHSTGGVGDKTSLLVAPIAAAAGLEVPMISGRSLGHTGGTLDKLESIPGYRTQLTLQELEAVLAQAGASIIGQTPELVPADRVLYALRDRTGTVESPELICASIMSKKLAASLDGLVLDVKTGSGAFLKDPAAARHLATLMVLTGEAGGTRTVALLTDMSQPLGRYAGNWLEVSEAVELLRGVRHPLNEDLRELSLVLAGWMIVLGGKASSPEEGRAFAETLLSSGAALECFMMMVAAQGGDAASLRPAAVPRRARREKQVFSHKSGFITAMDCEAVGWAVQRLGAGRGKPEVLGAALAGIEMMAKIGSPIRKGEPLVTMFAHEDADFAEPEAFIEGAITVGDRPSPQRALVHGHVTADTIAAAAH